MNNINEEETKKDNKEPNENMNQNEEEKTSNKPQEDNIYIEPVRNAEIEIIKEGNETLAEGITNKKGIMKYLVDKNENNLLIKVSKTGYYRVERVFKRNENLKENEEPVLFTPLGYGNAEPRETPRKELDEFVVYID